MGGLELDRVKWAEVKLEPVEVMMRGAQWWRWM
jgi:hypothetical protein